MALADLTRLPHTLLGRKTPITECAKRLRKNANDGDKCSRRPLEEGGVQET